MYPDAVCNAMLTTNNFACCDRNIKDVVPTVRDKKNAFASCKFAFGFCLHNSKLK